jgi:hypothetical protein
VMKGIARSIVSQLFGTLVQSAINQLVAHMMAKPVKIAEATSQAGLVGAGTAASLATNPITALGAIPAGVAAMTAALATFVPVAAAARGFDVGNFSPVTQLHPKEMVLPAALANRVRNMTGGGGGGVTVVINATDAKSVRRLLLDNPDALGEAISQARRKGKL